MAFLFCFLQILSIVCGSHTTRKYDSFPKDFLFGTGTSSYQVEGAWNLSGKGESIWDRGTHTTSFIVDGSTGDVACDSYHNYREDIRILQQLKVHCYRFSVSWTRLFPNGTVNNVNQDGIDYYNNLIDGLRAVGIQPMITLFHWDTPQRLQDLGGWASDRMIEWYTEYADKVFQLYGDRVKAWTTFNEPANYCQFGYDQQSAPFLNSSGIGSYLCAHNIIKAHAEVYDLYQRKYKQKQNGKIGISLDTFWSEPADPNSVIDQNAAEFAIEFYFGWFAWPIFKTGDYPASVKNRVNQRSKVQGFKRSRLPTFTPKEQQKIRHSADYLGLNHYATFLMTPDDQPAAMYPTRQNDRNLIETVDPEWQTTSRYGFTVRPESLRKLLLWIGQKLGKHIQIAITENGYNGADTETLDDPERINYLNGYLQAVLDAMNQGANVKAYTWWSLMDNFEWADGYTKKFGLYRVDFKDEKRPRTAKKSAMVYQNIIATRKVNPDFDPQQFAH